MIVPPKPANESERLSALRSYGILDTPPESAFDDLTALAAHICDTPVALVSLVDADRQWFKSKIGVSASETPRNISFCTHTILQSDPLIVQDATRDPRFQSSPLVAAGIRAYAGIPLVNEQGFALGALCVSDASPREFTPEQIQCLRRLANQVISQLELRRAARALAEVAEQRRRAEHELAEREERFALVVAGTNDGIWDFSLIDDTTYHSERCSELLGLQADEKLTRNLLFQKIHPDDRTPAGNAMEKHLRDRVPLDIEYRLQVSPGQYRWFRFRGRAVWDAQGRPTRMVGAITDISNQKAQEEILRNYNRELWEIKSELESQARELAKRSEELELARRQAENASRIKSDFLANMSHEIRTPMNAILGYTNLMLAEEQSPDERCDALRIIRRNGEHLLSVLNDILDISKIESGKLTLEKIPCNVPQIVADVTSLLRVSAVEKGISFDVEYLSPIPVPLQTDPTRVRQILLNLASNAVKFTDKGGVKIIVAVSQSAIPRLKIEVRDTGIGLSEEQQSRLFQSFMQADASTTRKFGGTGLGLVISRRLSEMLGGQLMVSSEQGKGSSFTLILPVQHAESASLLTPAEGMIFSPEPVMSQNNVRLSGRILLAEDGPDNQRLFLTHLQRAGAQVEIASNGRIAVEMVQQAAERGEPFDLIFMDMQMPELDGYSATRMLRKMKFTVPIVALTAHAMAADRTRCIESGCNDYRAKPIDKQALIAAAAQHLKSTGEAAPLNPSPACEPGLVRSIYADDPDIREILRDYVRGLPETAQHLQQYTHGQDLAALKRLLHQVKGSGGGYGFNILSSQAAAAEEAAKIGAEMDEIKARVDSLLATMRSIEGYDASQEATHVAKNPSD